MIGEMKPISSNRESFQRLQQSRIDKIEVKRSSVVRRAKLYFLRDRVGKAVRLKERRKT